MISTDPKAVIFEIDMSGVARMAAVIPDLNDDLSFTTESVLTEWGMMMTARVAPRTPVNYGYLRSAIQYPHGFELDGGTSFDEMRGIVGVGDSGGGVVAADYVLPVEYGSKPHWAPIAPLKLWAIRKFGDERIAYPVRAAIAKRGTQGARMFQSAWWEGGRDATYRMVKQIPVRALKRFSARTGLGG